MKFAKLGLTLKDNQKGNWFLDHSTTKRVDMILLAFGLKAHRPILRYLTEDRKGPTMDYVEDQRVQEARSHIQEIIELYAEKVAATPSQVVMALVTNEPQKLVSAIEKRRLEIVEECDQLNSKLLTKDHREPLWPAGCSIKMNPRKVNREDIEAVCMAQWPIAIGLLTEDERVAEARRNTRAKEAA